MKKTFRVVYDVISVNSYNITVETLATCDTADEARYMALDMLEDKSPYETFHAFEVSCEEVTEKVAEEVNDFNSLLGDIEIDL